MPLPHLLDEAIKPFPANENREQFSWWLAGFTQSRGSFDFSADANTYQSDGTFARSASFQIMVFDDLDILRLIRSFLGVGDIYADAGDQKTRPFGYLTVIDSAILHDVIIPHFRRYPLFGMKAQEFTTWCDGVDMLYRKTQEMN